MVPVYMVAGSTHSKEPFPGRQVWWHCVFFSTDVLFDARVKWDSGMWSPSWRAQKWPSHAWLPHVPSIPPSHVFLTAGLWATVHFALSSGLEFRDANPPTAMAVPPHKGAGEGCGSTGQVPEPCRCPAIQSYIKKKKSRKLQRTQGNFKTIS